MVLETLRHQQHIKQFSIELPEKSVKTQFDPQKFVPESDINILKEHIAASSNSMDFWSGLHNLSLLRPKQNMQELLTETRFTDTLTELSDARQKDDSEKLFNLIANIGLVSHDFLEEFSITDEEWEKGLIHYKTAIQVKRMFLYPEIGRGLLLARPEFAERLWEDTPINQGAYAGLLVEMSDTLFRLQLPIIIRLDPIEEIWRDYAATASQFRLLFPHKFSPSLLVEHKDAWKAMKDACRQLGQPYSTTNLGLAGSLTLLAADLIRFTDHGYEITMQKSRPAQLNQTPLPIERSF